VRLLTIAAAGSLIFGVIDGSLERIPSPTIGYRLGFIFSLALLFGWRGLVWGHVPALVTFAGYFGWRAFVFVEPLYLISHAFALLLAQRFNGKKPWFSSERSTLAFLLGALASPLIPAIFNNSLLRLLGATGRLSSSAPIMSWLRESAAALAVAPTVLVYFRGPLQRWVGFPSQGEPRYLTSAREAFELTIEVAVWTAALWLSVHFQAAFHLNITYLTFLPPLAFTLRYGMRLTTVALAANTVVATTMWFVLRWSPVISQGDLRLLIAIYSVTILILATVVDERRSAGDQLQNMVGALKASEEKFAAAFYSAPLFLFITDLADGRIVEVNDTFLRRTAFSRSDLIGKTTVELLFQTPEDRAALLEELTVTGRVTGLEVSLPTKSGDRIPCLMVATVVPIHGQRRILSIVEDIGDLKRAQEATAKLERQSQQAQKMETLGRFAAGIAHDFNNLLTVINGYARIAYSKLAGQPELQGRVGEICKAGSSAATLTEQLLAFSQRRVIPAQALNLNEALLASAGMLERLLGVEIALETDLEVNLHPAVAAPGEVQQILMNLAANARDAMPGGGILSIRTRNLEARNPEGAGPLQSWAVLSVEDTGEGIAPEHLPHVFEPFFTTKELHNGTGLGLATVYGLVRQRGGWIDVESRVRAGTSFRVYFPVAAEPVLPFQPREHQETARSGATILLVEDQPEVRNFAAEVLRSQGYRVIEAEGGEQALEHERNFEGRIDLLVSDVIMPIMRGPELAGRMRVSRSGLPVLFISGFAPLESMDSAPLLNKPFSPEQLLDAVGKALAGSVV
jgi:PAS domain S-box-containing protein